MLPLETAIDRILSCVPEAIAEEVSLLGILDRVLTHPVSSIIDLPPFDNSAMDGYAVRHADTQSATKDHPVMLKIVGRAAAGQAWRGTLDPGTCLRLFTGSAMPEGANAVVMQEDAMPDSHDNVRIIESIKPWENVRFRGEDLKQGQIIAAAGEFCRAGTISLLAAAGCARVRVGRRPEVALLATGSELVEQGDSLGKAQIYESNRIALAALVGRAGAIPKLFPIVTDTADQTQRALKDALEQCDIVITTGGVSVGDMDFVKSAFQEIGGTLEFWKVAIRPGRPFVFGKTKDKLFFGLPGNPVSALVTFLLLVRPALLRWQGAAKVGLASLPGILAENIINPGERRHFIRVTFDQQGHVRSAGVQASHVLSSLSAANGLLDMPPGLVLQLGEPVQILRWD